MKAGRIVAGVLVALGAVWLGPYFLHLLPAGHWAAVPISFTAAFAAAMGIALMIYGVIP